MSNDSSEESGRAIVQADTGPDTGPRLDFEADREQTDRRELYLDGSLVLVGCGKSKRDPENPADLHVASVGPDEPMTSLPGADTGPAWEARDLYTSTYFGVKANLADLVTTWAQGYDADPWAVLSAEHGIVPCSRNLKYYDTKISELGDDPTDPDDRVNNPFKRRRPDGQEIVTEMDAWAADVAASLCRWVASFRDQHAKPWENDAQELIVLAGQDYIEPLRERGVFEYGISRMSGDPNEGYTFPLEPRYLFEEIPAGGNGDQMGWMSSAIDELEPLVSGEPETEQDTLVTDGGQPAEGGRGGHHGARLGHEQDADDNEYATPPEIWRPLARAVDGFDTDPASGAEPEPIAPTRYTAEDDGLRQSWHGWVWLNPPWSSNGDGSAKKEWARKARNEAARDAVDGVVMLLPCDTSSHVFHDHVAAASVFCLVGPGRIPFRGEDRNPSFELVLAVYADDVPGDLVDALDALGIVVEGRTVVDEHPQASLNGVVARE